MTLSTLRSTSLKTGRTIVFGYAINSVIAHDRSFLLNSRNLIVVSLH